MKKFFGCDKIDIGVGRTPPFCVFKKRKGDKKMVKLPKGKKINGEKSMFRKVVIDEFFENQPEKTFQEDLKKYNVPVIDFRECDAKDTKQVPFRNAYLDMGVFERSSSLYASYADFNAFLCENHLNGNRYPVRLKQLDGFDREEYDIFITASFCEICVIF